MQYELTRELIDEIKVIVEHDERTTAFRLMKDLHAADIAEVFEHLNAEEAKYLYLLLEGEKAADVLIEMEPGIREKFLKILPGNIIARQFIDNMDSDDAADIIGELSEQKKEEVLLHIKDLEQASDIADLLRYDENTAGGLMAKELVTVNENWDINTCIKEIRKQSLDIDELYYVYVVDDSYHLKGTLSLKKLLLRTKNTSVIKNIYHQDVIYVKTDTPSNEVANVMNKYNLVSLPVVDSIGRLAGRITIDDVVDVIREEAEKDYQMMSGISEGVEHNAKVWILTRARLPWLFVGLIGGIFGAQVIGVYETDLRIYPEMAFFIPLIAAMGGNVGVQSSSIIVQGLANKSLGLINTRKQLFKEFLVALFNGIILSLSIFSYNMIFSKTLALTITVSSALFSVIIFASLFGTLVPLILNKFKIDPALATGPFITTVNDIMGLFIYLTIGRILYGIM